MVDKRHQLRIKIIQQLYANSYKNQKPLHLKTKLITSNIDKLDKYIIKNALKYDVDKIAKIDLAILRLGLYELLIEKEQPPKVIINEAIELAKQLGGEQSPSFINAILGKVYQQSIKS